MTDPIVVLGFGRSGSTWVGDVISTVAGGIMLNEPLNPCMGIYPEHLAPGSPGHYAGERLRAMLAGEERDPWLLRGYFAPLATADHHELEAFWDSRPIVGLKETFHAAWSIDWLVERFGRRIVYVWRSPYAVIPSVVARPSFWALGWPAHADAVMRHAGASWDGARSYVERVAAVWAAAHTAVLDACERLSVPIIDFEDLEAPDHQDDTWAALYGHLRLEPRAVDLTRRSRTTGAARAVLAGDDALAVQRIVAGVEDRRAAYRFDASRITASATSSPESIASSMLM